MTPTQLITNHLSYDPASGEIHWIKPLQRRPISGQAGTVTKHGRFVQLKGYRVSAPEIAWVLITGHLPTGRITFKNGDRTDASFNNLVETPMEANTHIRNSCPRPNMTGHVGVYPIKLHPGFFAAYIHYKRKRHYLGSYPTAEMAGAAYQAAKGRIERGLGVTE